MKNVNKPIAPANNATQQEWSDYLTSLKDYNIQYLGAKLATTIKLVVSPREKLINDLLQNGYLISSKEKIYNTPIIKPTEDEYY